MPIGVQLIIIVYCVIRSFVKSEYKNFTPSFFERDTYSNLIFNFFRFIYYILFIPVILRKHKNLDYYFEYYFEKFVYKFICIFNKRYIDVENIYTLKSTYPKDLKKYCKPRVFNI